VYIRRAPYNTTRARRDPISIQGQADSNRIWAATAPVREIGLRSSGGGEQAFRDAILPN
jgi:hypothetical protein